MSLLSNLSSLFGYSYNYDYDYSGGLGSSSAKAAAGAFAGIFIVYLIIMLVVLAFTIICQWKIFTKAGCEGWKAIVPFLNMYTLTEISGYSGWLFLICLIPGVVRSWVHSPHKLQSFRPADIDERTYLMTVRIIV